MSNPPKGPKNRFRGGASGYQRPWLNSNNQTSYANELTAGTNQAADGGSVAKAIEGLENSFAKICDHMDAIAIAAYNVNKHTPIDKSKLSKMISSIQKFGTKEVPLDAHSMTDAQQYAYYSNLSDVEEQLWLCMKYMNTLVSYVNKAYAHVQTLIQIYSDAGGPTVPP